MAFSGDRTTAHLREQLAMQSADPTIINHEPAVAAEVAPIAEETSEKSGRFGTKAVVGALVGGIALANLAPKVNVSFERCAPAVAQAETPDFNAEECATVEFKNVSNDAEKFAPKAFLPKQGDQSASEYIDGLYSEGGALTSDKNSLAATMAAIQPFIKDDLNNPNYSYVDTYKDKVSAYGAPGGEKVAAEDCETSYQVLTQLASDNDEWALAGDRASNFSALRGDKYNISGAEVTKPQVVQETLGGIEISFNGTAKDVNGNKLQGGPSVLIRENGEFVIKGLSPSDAESTKKDKQKNGGNKNDKKNHKKGKSGGENNSQND
ncbi:hypothetical protein KC963_05585, partial [Candidatus Saccharibacteria bacterium]|nr:hypothetical protein [Candidatus Saccharibacteria bacterium]